MRYEHKIVGIIIANIVLPIVGRISNMYKLRVREILTSVLILMILLITTSASAAQRRMYENFDDQDVDSPWQARVYGGFNIVPPRCSYDVGRNGTGYCIGSGSDLGNDDAVWIESGYGEWPTDEYYVSFWVKYPVAVYQNTGENIKLFYPGFGTGSVIESGLENLSTGASVIFAWYNNVLQFNSYVTFPNAADGNWHHYEWWVKFSTGALKMWYDRPEGDFTTEADIAAPTTGTYLKLNRINSAGTWGAQTISRMNAGSMDASGDSNFTRFIDDVEVWDGIPGESLTPPTVIPPVDTTPPTPPSGVTTNIIQ